MRFSLQDLLSGGMNRVWDRHRGGGDGGGGGVGMLASQFGTPTTGGGIYNPAPPDGGVVTPAPPDGGGIYNPEQAQNPWTQGYGQSQGQPANLQAMLRMMYLR